MKSTNQIKAITRAVLWLVKCSQDVSNAMEGGCDSVRVEKTIFQKVLYFLKQFLFTTVKGFTKILNVVYGTRPWQTYQFSFFMPYIIITPLNYWQSTENSLKWWAASSKENFGTAWKLFTWNVKKLAFLRIKNAKFMTFLTLSGNSGNSVDRHDGMFTKKFFCYFTRNKSVWLRFPASPWMNLWMIFLNSL